MPVKFTDEIIKNIFKLTEKDTVFFNSSSNFEVVNTLTINETLIDLILSNCIADTRVFYMTLPQESFKNLLEVTPVFAEYYYNLADNAFVKEFNYKPGDLKKTIEDTNYTLVSALDTESTNFINIYFEINSGDLVTSIFSDVSYPSNHEVPPTVYYWSLFTNPTYYRKGFAESLIKLITMTNISIIEQYQTKKNEDDCKCPLFIALSYVWNTSSINLFTKLGYICTHTITPENNSENQDTTTLQKYTYKNTEYFENVQLHFVYDPAKELDEKINRTNNNFDSDIQYDTIEKITLNTP
jgi:hypothetical protein